MASNGVAKASGIMLTAVCLAVVVLISVLPIVGATQQHYIDFGVQVAIVAGLTFVVAPWSRDRFDQRRAALPLLAVLYVEYSFAQFHPSARPAIRYAIVALLLSSAPFLAISAIVGGLRQQGHHGRWLRENPGRMLISGAVLASVLAGLGTLAGLTPQLPAYAIGPIALAASRLFEAPPADRVLRIVAVCVLVSAWAACGHGMFRALALLQERAVILAELEQGRYVPAAEALLAFDAANSLQLPHRTGTADIVRMTERAVEEEDYALALGLASFRERRTLLDATQQLEVAQLYAGVAPGLAQTGDMDDALYAVSRISTLVQPAVALALFSEMDQESQRLLWHSEPALTLEGFEGPGGPWLTRWTTGLADPPSPRVHMWSSVAFRGRGAEHLALVYDRTARGHDRYDAWGLHVDIKASSTMGVRVYARAGDLEVSGGRARLILNVRSIGPARTPTSPWLDLNEDWTAMALGPGTFRDGDLIDFIGIDTGGEDVDLLIDEVQLYVRGAVGEPGSR